ncbi:transcriptional regulator [Bacillus sp. 1P06AnD]|uniref:helix-turn-helix transcriptional regulator n=1 Tax=Bacillus sp. 1P06AnD TaxID=3132208 RepID=UPI0039A0DD6F
MMEHVNLSEADHQILASYQAVIDGLADFLGDSSEIVLHSLEDYQHSVVQIANNHHTGREIGAPITNLALHMLKEINSQDNQQFQSYFTRNKQNQLMKSSTMVIYGEKKNIIGLLCININLDRPFSEIMKTFSPQEIVSEKHDEYFASNVEEMIHDIIQATIEEVDSSAVSHANRNKQIIAILHERGVFQMRDAAGIVAKALKITKHTVYLHLRNLQAKDEK